MITSLGEEKASAIFTKPLKKFSELLGLSILKVISYIYIFNNLYKLARTASLEPKSLSQEAL